MVKILHVFCPFSSTQAAATSFSCQGWCAAPDSWAVAVIGVLER
ncbi:hypothetical protein FVEG_00599 [Fusarium verticillioides 7600]|uniref:Uncharacterized protein n=1 Tax=Gibberella moniliformis (strain M3125 / FGSC 7600) TaxID=334819 RepID=W7LVV6_GIBM7|nr:hypothetical protein FVEG_00599 [Fusarium verticillioides 7600]EWG36682.1 hypothetical protein FVEG_00599 [Fusarium verticillioides 7600]